jgi:glutaredoxin
MTPKPPLAVAAAIAALLAATAVHAQTTHRWIDPATGRTVFSDQPPPPGVKRTTRQEAPVAGNGGQQSYAVRIAAEKFPVVLYTSSDCTEYCAHARNLLNGRGVPFQEKIVQPGSPVLDELKKLTGGEALIPLVTVGTLNFKGFSANEWNQLLDLAGYPKTAPFGSRPAAAPPSSPPPIPDAQNEPPAQENPPATDDDAQ